VHQANTPILIRPIASIIIENVAKLLLTFRNQDTSKATFIDRNFPLKCACLFSASSCATFSRDYGPRRLVKPLLQVLPFYYPPLFYLPSFLAKSEVSKPRKCFARIFTTANIAKRWFSPRIRSCYVTLVILIFLRRRFQEVFERLTCPWCDFINEQ
jgi:hypothetical protein